MHELNPLTMPLDGIKLIEASAGTGKTYTIATLYLRLLIERGLSVREILVVTYTNAATEELRGRIRDRLRHAIHLLNLGESAIAAEEDQVMVAILRGIEHPAQMIQHLIDELTCIDEAAIHTIHGFSQRMLLDNAFESGALFETEFLQSEDALLDEVVRDYWRQHFYSASAGLAAQIHRRWSSPQALKQALRNTLNKAYERLLPELNEADYSEARYAELYKQLQTLWATTGDTLLSEISEAAGNKTLSAAKENYHSDKLGSAAEALALFFAEAPRVYALPYGFELFTQSTLDGAILKAAEKKGLSAPQHEFFTLCDELQQLVNHLLIGIQQQALAWCRAEMVTRKDAAAVLSYNDLLTQLHDALKGEQGPALSAHIVSRYPYAMIDEFQDTDPEQFRIFQAIYGEHAEASEGRGFYMIGDPKQAIYSFRGADIFTYMLAKEATAADSLYTLDTNWRSSSALIEAVNTLYEQSHAPFIYAGHIDYHRVQAAGAADATPLIIEGQPPAPLQCWFLERNAERITTKDPSQGRLTKTQLQPEVAAATAAECVRLLNLGKQHLALIGEAPLQPQDIAILVRDRYEADEIRFALRRQGIASAYYSRDSVFNSDEALQLLRLLQAISEPGNESLLRAALSSALIALSATELDQLLQDDLAWESQLTQIQRYHNEWQLRGFMAMFRRMLHELAIPHRLLGYNDGERRLTNLLQLGELIQSASRENEGIENQLRWLHEQCSEPDGNLEDQRLRLESDEELVKVVNIHTSKGLEYPIVFLPFLWSCKPTKTGQPLYVHDAHNPASVVLDLDPDQSTYELAEKERLAEDLRLLYVALTRAQHLCYFSYGYVKDLERSALAWLLHGSEAELPLADLAAQLDKAEDKALLGRLRELAERSGHSFAITPLPGHQPALARELAAHESLQARQARRPLEWYWRMTSYSGLTASHSAASPAAQIPSEFRETGSRNEDARRAEAAEAEPPSGLQLCNFPKGARAGTFMHTILELIDFAADSDATIGKVVQEQLLRFGFDPIWQGVIEQMIKQTLDTRLNDQGLSLRQLTAPQRIVEMEFQYPIQRLSAESLNHLIAGLGNEPEGESAALHFSPMSGIMRGFIDLTFEYRGRYYIADYKSNWLGFYLEDYTRERLQQVICEHRYDLQYLIYTLALHRYLQANLAGYDYADHFGGVYYLFLRGLDSEAGPDTGVYYDRPPLALIEQLDRLMWQEH